MYENTMFVSNVSDTWQLLASDAFSWIDISAWRVAVSPSILPDIHTGLSIAKAYGIYRANRSLLCSAFTPTCFYLDYIWQKSKEIN